MTHRRLRSVFVRAYNRVRLGRPEYVCKHYRSLPGQMSFYF